MPIIGLHGGLGVGKDTAYTLINDEFPGRFIRKGFADKLKISAARALGFEGSVEECIDFCNKLKQGGDIDIWIDKVNPICISGRQYLQWYGTEAHREVFGYDFWLDAVFPKDKYHNNVIVTDVRFKNEAKKIKGLGGKIWKIVRNTGVNDTHASEASFPDNLIDVIIENNGTIEDFKWALLRNLEL